MVILHWKLRRHNKLMGVLLGQVKKIFFKRNEQQKLPIRAVWLVLLLFAD